MVSHHFLENAYNTEQTGFCPPTSLPSTALQDLWTSQASHLLTAVLILSLILPPQHGMVISPTPGFPQPGVPPQGDFSGTLTLRYLLQNSITTTIHSFF